MQSVREIAGQETQVGSTYSMERELPSGHVQKELEIFARAGPNEFGPLDQLSELLRIRIWSVT